MSSIEEFTRPRRKEIVYKPIHVLYGRPKSDCEFFRVIEEAGSYMAICMVLGRHLTKDEVIKCENYWKSCPYRRIGKQMLGEISSGPS